MKLNQIAKAVLILAGLALCFSINAANYSSHNYKPIAFPGAEGAGKYVTGGRGGKVVEVTNLNDSGEGSLRAALQQNGTRTVVFRISGTINLKSELEINEGNLTIAGQTAPGDGICVKGFPTIIRADNVIIRFLRFRLGDINHVQGDAVSCRNQRDILIDHCSFSWATDECASLYELHQSSIQWCLVAESLNSSVHEKGDHGYGGIWGGDTVSFHHNLFAHNSSRNPRFNGARYNVPWNDLVDFRNNVIYNWGINSTYAGERGKHNLVANYYKPGPATSNGVRQRIFNAFRSADRYPFGQFYISENYMEGSETVSRDNWAGGVDLDEGAVLEQVKSDSPFFCVPIPKQTAHEAYQAVLKSVGASVKRDAVDARIIADVKNGTGTCMGKISEKPGIIDTQEDVGGWPELKSLPAPQDSDHDGMPDAWENKHGMDPKNAADGNQYQLNEAYTNLEVYLNELVSYLIE
ncbi:pectate lyase family protein [Gaoshiqia sediminis]|uniref:Pectate lyase n=1 Tax=Gaoshiqia sediminis TaxID=2986998 RepID=A0AA42C8I4_9BACT|nr:pectate lyase [Gaoshiqia sediminis]MCW0481247.1 pectate lyase [Gaoshiqia sediminis]